MKNFLIGISIFMLVIGTGLALSMNRAQAVSMAPAPDYKDIAAATKEALEQGIYYGITLLEKDGGFSNSVHHIYLPTELEKATQLARSNGLGSYVDDFERSLNRVAEEAVGSAYPVFKSAVSELPMQDVVAILNGPDDAFTNYFKTNSAKKLENTFLPLVAKAMKQNNVAQSSKRLISKLKRVAKTPAIRLSSFDWNTYVTQQAMQAMFVEIAVEEQKIRSDPTQGSTSSIRRVFGFFRAKSSPE